MCKYVHKCMSANNRILYKILVNPCNYSKSNTLLIQPFYLHKKKKTFILTHTQTLIYKHENVLMYVH